MKDFTLSICQFPIQFLDWKKNSKKAIEYIRMASFQDSDFIIFPEMTLTGISRDVSTMADFNNKNLIFFQAAAKKYKIAIGFGWGKPKDDKLENHYTVIDPSGNILSDYIKLHPFSYGGEDKCFVSGSSFSTFFYCGFHIATFVCYDLRFPEIFQAASKECDFIIVSANWPKERALHWKTLGRARAIENQIYLAACNCVGKMESLVYSGDSALFSPEGEILCSLSGSEGLLTYSITNHVKLIRENFPVKQDRKISYYKSIL